MTSLRRFELAHLLAFYCFRFPRTAHCTIWPTFRAIREFLLVSRARMISTVVSLQVEQRRGLTFGTGGGYRLLLSNVYEYGWSNSKVTKFRLATTRRFPAGWHGWAWLLFFSESTGATTGSFTRKTFPRKASRGNTTLRPPSSATKCTIKASGIWPCTITRKWRILWDKREPKNPFLLHSQSNHERNSSWRQRRSAESACRNRQTRWHENENLRFIQRANSNGWVQVVPLRSSSINL